MIRRATEKDLQSIADLDRMCFSGNRPQGIAEKWIDINFHRNEQYHYFVFEKENRVVAYIGWEIKNGFAREIPVVELEKLGVHEDFRGQKIATQLVQDSFQEMKQWISEQQPTAKQMRVVVWSLKSNEKAIALYSSLCNEGIQGERKMFSSEEVFLRGSYNLE